MRFIGLDFETSGPSIWHGAVPIQIGIAELDNEKGPQLFEALIGGWVFDNLPYEWNYESEKVHGITQDRLLQRDVDSVEAVDWDAARWLQGREPATHLVGWNVGSFDLPFLQRFMPILASQVSYRTIDLNAICFALALPGTRSWDTIKHRAKAFAAEQIGGEEKWHSASYDALASLYALDYLRGLLLLASGMGW